MWWTLSHGASVYASLALSFALLFLLAHWWKSTPIAFRANWRRWRGRRWAHSPH